MSEPFVLNGQLTLAGVPAAASTKFEPLGEVVGRTVGVLLQPPELGCRIRLIVTERESRSLPYCWELVSVRCWSAGGARLGARAPGQSHAPR